jgi:hypothetical protein
MNDKEEACNNLVQDRSNLETSRLEINFKAKSSSTLKGTEELRPF